MSASCASARHFDCRVPDDLFTLARCGFPQIKNVRVVNDPSISISLDLSRPPHLARRRLFAHQVHADQLETNRSRLANRQLKRFADMGRLRASICHLAFGQLTIVAGRSDRVAGERLEGNEATLAADPRMQAVAVRGPVVRRKRGCLS
jgi:hypothetical protein